MKKILVFSSAFIPSVGGAEVALDQIMNRSARDFHFTLLTYRFDRHWPKSGRLTDNIFLYRFGYNTKFDRWFIFPLWAWWKGWQLHKNKKERFDLFWGMMVSYASIGGYLLKLCFPKTPFLLTLQEGDDSKHLRWGKLGLIGLFWWLLVRKADQTQAISNYLARRASVLGAKRVVVIPNGAGFPDIINKDFSPEDLAPFREQTLKIKSHEKVVVTVSRLVKKNAIDTVIKALKRLPSGYILLILGSGEEEGMLRKLVEELDLVSRVKFLGNIPHSEILLYLKVAEVFVRPSRSEGLGNSFLEAMAAGIPVIGTPVGGIPDFLKDGETGLFCRVDDPADLAEKIKILTTQKELADRIKIKAQNLAISKYSWQTVAERMQRIFTELIDNRA